ncbi:TY-Chap2 family putative peptide chaperone [Arthrobacter sp. SAFR-044]|uniref:TY-Chap2 family putative peptide chaperone n=1 Tax=Arthrobacter sp. SAFR-044 TaxID=3387278 RepID=UPI003F7CB882
MRHTKAVVFWLASELARRHPHYVLYSEGLDGLTLVSSAGPTINISRSAIVSVGGRELVGPSELLATDDRRALIKELEEKIGLPVRRLAAPTTERTLVYRAMAHIAALVVGDKATWDFIATDLQTPAGAWNLIRNGDCVALLTPDGNVRISDQHVNLLERYHAHSHRMTPMIGEVFGAVLP